jgi:hypothetical protein
MIATLGQVCPERWVLAVSNGPPARSRVRLSTLKSATHSGERCTVMDSVFEPTEEDRSASIRGWAGVVVGALLVPLPIATGGKLLDVCLAIREVRADGRRLSGTLADEGRGDGMID